MYSFGVLLLEIISGRSSSKAAFGDDMLILVEWVSLWTLSAAESSKSCWSYFIRYKVQMPNLRLSLFH